MELQDRINAKIARGAYQSTFRGETIRATTVVKNLGCQVESQGSTRAEAQMRVTKAIKAQARCSRGLWAPRSIGLATKIRLGQALVRSVLRYAAEAHAWQPRDVETLEEDPCSCVSRVDAGPGLEHTQWCQRCKFGSYSGQRSGCEKKPLQAYWESIFHVRNPQETRSGENGCLRYLRRISASCFRMLQEMTSGQSNNRVRSLRVRNVEQESEVKEASKYISSSGVGKALAKRRQRHV